MRKVTTTAIFLLCLSVFGSSGGFLYAESSTHVGVQPRTSSSSLSWVPPPGGLQRLRRYDTTINSSDEDVGKHSNIQKNQRKNKLRKREEYERRRLLWMERYGSLEALQSTFGTGRPDGSQGGGYFSGDLTPEQTRFLYHTLLPRSLLGLFEMELMKPEELAPLAYQARNAAKQYARSRCVWWGRAATAIFDQYRNVRSKRGFGKPGSLSWEEIWSKYEAQIVQEACAEELDDDAITGDDNDYNNVTLVKNQEKKRFKEKDLTMRIYLRILERSCATNQAFDRMFLKNNSNSLGSNSSTTNEEDTFLSMGNQLEQDVREILLRPKDIKKLQKKEDSREKKEMKAQRKEEKKQEYLELKKQKRLLKQQRKKEKREEKIKMKKMKMREEPLLLLAADTSESTNATDLYLQEGHDQDQQEERWQVMRILAGTRYKFRKILSRDC